LEYLKRVAQVTQGGEQLVIIGLLVDLSEQEHGSAKMSGFELGHERLIEESLLLG
jgi:hypothetical protein